MYYPERLFDAFMLPLEAAGLGSIRSRLIPRARGHVLEIGSGTGANLPHYDLERVTGLVLTDYEVANLLRLRVARRANTDVIEADVHDLPFADGEFDTVVVTLVLCSVEDQRRALSQIRRVLAPGGRLLFMEHVRPHGRLGGVVDRVNPAWFACNGQCRINRDTLRSIRQAGFAVDAPGHRARGLIVHGEATPA